MTISKTKRLILAIVACLCFVQQSNAQKLQNSIFWEISGNGIKQPSYLFGTHHAYDPTNIKKSKVVTEKLDQSQQVVGELVLDMGAMFQVMNYLTFKGDTTLSTLLDEKQYQKLNDYFSKNMGMPVKMFDKMKPIILTQLISAKKYAKLNPDSNGKMPKGGLGGFMNSTIDGYFQEYGKAHHKKVLGLETVVEQSKMLFNGIPIDQQIEGLMKSLDDKVSMEEIEKLNKYYKNQDLNAINKEIVQKMEKEQYIPLLKKRNDAWIPKMEKMMKDGSTFFAVGAAHLVGKDGVLYQLKKQGYKLKPIKMTL